MTDEKVLLASDVNAGTPQWKECPSCRTKDEEIAVLKTRIAYLIREGLDDKTYIQVKLKQILQDSDLCKDANYECDFRVDDTDLCPCQWKDEYK